MPGQDHTHTILIVEDMGDTREALSTLLELQGAVVANASNGLEALELMRTYGLRPCVVVLDLLLPTMDGLTFRQEQMKHPRLADIPIIALTGHEGLRKQAAAEGFAAALLKPCECHVLLGWIEAACLMHRGTKARG